MAITLPGIGGNSPISADLMYQFYDNKAITPQIRTALQKKQDEADKESGNESSSSSSASKFGPATRVNITDQIIRMNIANGTTKFGKDEEKPAETSDSKIKKPSRYDVLAEVKKNVAEREASAKAEKDAQLKEIADKVTAAGEAAKKEEGTSPVEG
ncbi:MAG: hypothetical protein LBQ76_01050 [Candidatus Fibromonas sp.]|nr:hypothetical protein [Candidatus Fibromonas sp.]